MKYRIHFIFPPPLAGNYDCIIIVDVSEQLANLEFVLTFGFRSESSETLTAESEIRRISFFQRKLYMIEILLKF